MGYEDRPPHPTWMEPIEWLDGSDAKYRLHVVASHPRMRLRRNCVARRCGRAIGLRDVNHARDAAACGVKDGDVARVFDDRGQLLAGVLTEVIRAGVIRVNEGSWFDPLEPDKVGSLCKW